MFRQLKVRLRPRRHVDVATPRAYSPDSMDALAEKLERKLHEWRPETTQKVRALVSEIIELADSDWLNETRSRDVEQEVLDIIDAPAPR
jgi:hypothetical protein